MCFHRSGLLVTLAFAALVSTAPAGASSYNVVWSPQTSANGDPNGRLFRENNGVLVGTSWGSSGHGIVFQLSPSHGSWTPSKIFGFAGGNGSNPMAGLVRDANGAFYGTTDMGGGKGSGTVFKLALTNGVWKETRLHSFGYGNDGTNPASDLTRVAATGALYGTTQYGGRQGEGTVFVMTYSNGAWSEQVLYNFDSYSNGRAPTAGVYRDSSGALYGTTSFGTGYGVGGIFKLAKSGGVWRETDLHDFGSVNGDGKCPRGMLIRDSNGVFYGTTEYGGAYGFGTVFKLAETGGVWNETVIWSFKGSANHDGAYPWAGVYRDSSGALYGTTNGEDDSNGAVFKLVPSGGSWTETVLHAFGGTGDGLYPAGAVIGDPNGDIFGTTQVGGSYNYGSVFEISP